MPISKTDFIRGLQCEKMLWLDAHKPEEKIIPKEVQERLDQGNEFGDIAMGIFGDFVETTVFKDDGRLYYSKMIESTRLLLDRGEKVICEGAFSWFGNFCATDILKKDGDCYCLYEVKNSAFLKREFLLDLAFQCLILKKCGVKIKDCFLVLNGEKMEAENPKREGQVCVERIKKENCTFEIFCVNKQVKALERIVNDRLFPLGKIKKKDAPTPCVAMGEQCEKPYECWYIQYCKNEAQKTQSSL